ncbi:MAG: hypothetical protein ACMUEL_08015 [Flavobacteriales bacterium Tduv]
MSKNPMGSRSYFCQYKALVVSGKARYKGLARVHTQHIMEAMVHNLYLVPGIIM